MLDLFWASSVWTLAYISVRKMWGYIIGFLIAVGSCWKVLLRLKSNIFNLTSVHMWLTFPWCMVCIIYMLIRTWIWPVSSIKRPHPSAQGMNRITLIGFVFIGVTNDMYIATQLQQQENLTHDMSIINFFLALADLSLIYAYIFN